jgi:dynein heavy chain, axonemal
VIDREISVDKDLVEGDPIDGIVKSKVVPIFGVLFRGGGAFQDYTEIKSLDMAAEGLKSSLEKYNQENPPINIVIFDYIIEHVLRICRVIKSPQSHCLLVGVGGSGKHSLAKLAGYMFSYTIHTIDLKYQYSADDWRDDIKKILYSAGVDQNRGVFVIYESQIVNEAFLEDLHNFLNSGEIPLLFTNEEIAKITGGNSGVVESDKVADWHKFVTSCKNNLTVVICMSPVGGKFRQRVRLFPALVNCTTIDWFLDWPNEGLSSVANFYLMNTSDVPENIIKGVSSVCASIFNDLNEKANELLNKEGRYVYNTSQSFIDFLRSFSYLLVTKKNSIEAVRKTYDTSLTLLQSTKEELKILQENLKAQEKDLGKHESDLKEIIKVVEEQEAELEKKQSQVSVEEAVVSKEVFEAETMKAECQAQLDIVMPELDNAREALGKLTKYEISELKAFNKPPLPVKMVLEAVCIILGVPPARYKKGGEFVEDYWMAAMGKKVLGDSKILEKLVTFDKVIISKNVIEKLENFIKNPEFDPEIASHASEAAKGMCLWVRAMVNLNYVQREIKPKEKALTEAQKHCDILKKQLKIKKKELSEIQTQMNALLTEKSKKEKEREEILQTIKRNKKKIDRAEKLIGGLGGEMQRWTVTIRLLASGLMNLVGDSLLGAAFITFLGPFPRAYREVCLEKWQTMITQHGVNNSQSFNLISMFSDPVSIREWIANDLPNDDYSVENVIILNTSLKYSICIDPQSQAYRWLLNTYSGVNVTRFSDNKFISSMEFALQFGNPIVIQIEESVDPVMLSILTKEFNQSGSIHFSDTDLRFSPNFKLFMITRLNNPHYHPELWSMVNLVNFAINSDGLYDQVLALIVTSERKELEERHINLINQTTQNKKELKNLESQIVEQLSTFQGDILEDEDLVAHLNALKQTAEDIAQRIRNSEKTEKRISKARDIYSSVASRATSLFFSVLDIAKIRQIYQFSLKWFLGNCQQVLKNPTDSNDENKRVVYLINSLTIHLHKKVCTSLFDKDKLLFSVLLSFKIIMTEEKMTKELISYLLDDNVERVIEESPVDFFSDEAWCKIRELSAYYPFREPAISFLIQQSPEIWKKIYVQTEKPELESIPGPYNLFLPTDQKSYEIKGREEGDVSSLFQYTQKRFEKRKTLEATLNDKTKKIFVYLQRMCVIKALRNERLMQTYELLISTVLGPEFLLSDPDTLESSFEESTASTPFLILHNFSSDPVSELITLCSRLKKDPKIMTLSLGLGKTSAALEIIEKAKTKGKWLLLQNVHLCESFLPVLEDTIEELNAPGTSRNFRLWLTSHPSSNLPISILQSCIKVTMEPAAGIKISLLRNLNAAETYFSGADDIQKKLIFSLCFAHSVIQERTRYIGVGWSRPYDFTESDFLASVSVVLNINVDKFGWEMLRFCIIDLTYGGRLSEPQDLNLLHCLLKSILSPDIKNPDFSLYEGQAGIPEKMDNFKSIYAAVEKMELIDSPEIYGLHANQAIKLETREGERILGLLSHIRKSALLIDDLESKKESGSDVLEVDQVSKQNRGKVLAKICLTIIEKIPKSFDLNSVKLKYPVIYEESLNTVLQEEIMRYNRLLDRVHSTTSSVYHAASGNSFMSLELEDVASDLLMGKVPQKWKQFSYPSAKNLAGYTENLIQRLNYMNKWISEGIPEIFWFPGLFYPQSFLTAVLQNHSRRHEIKMEDLEFKTRVLDNNETVEPGCILDGLILEAARWEGKLLENLYKEFYIKMPKIHAVPQKIAKVEEKVYKCPLYKTVLRVGTQGQESNFIMYVDLKTDIDPSHWAKRGVALVCEYDSI